MISVEDVVAGIGRVIDSAYAFAINKSDSVVMSIAVMIFFIFFNVLNHRTEERRSVGFIVVHFCSENRRKTEQQMVMIDCATSIWQSKDR